MPDLMVHASQCRSSPCQYPNCRKVQGIFRHGMVCRVRASGGCVLCKKMWYSLQIHARACKETKCNVPRCKDLKEHLRRLQQQSDSRRRATVTEMIRQQAANCRKGKGIFRHGMVCRVRASGGCVLCKKMWYLLQMHAQACKETKCNVPRCKDLKEHLRRLQQQSDSRREQL